MSDEDQPPSSSKRSPGSWSYSRRNNPFNKMADEHKYSPGQVERNREKLAGFIDSVAELWDSIFSSEPEHVSAPKKPAGINGKKVQETKDSTTSPHEIQAQAITPPPPTAGSAKRVSRSPK